MPDDKINGAQLLDDVANFLARFVIYPDDHSRIAHTLWIAHTFLMDHWDSTPRLAFLSAESGSGKTRALEVTEHLVINSVITMNVSTAYLFRKMGHDDRCVLLFDEIDTIFGDKARENEDIRGLINAGHRKGAVTGRVVMHGQTAVLQDFPAYSAVALAGLDDLPDTIMTRAIVIKMRRRAPGELIEPWRARINEAEAEALRDRLKQWTDAYEFHGWPSMPVEVTDRSADVWEALLAIADHAQGEWPERARSAAVHIVTKGQGDMPHSIGIALLKDIKMIFDQVEKDRMTSKELVIRLANISDAPWGEVIYNTQMINQRSLAKRLRAYEITPRKIRVDGDQPLQGYMAADFVDAWTRYLPAPHSQNSGTTGTDGTQASQGLPHSEHVPPMNGTVNGSRNGFHAQVPSVPVVPEFRSRGEYEDQYAEAQERDRSSWQ